MNVMFDRNLMNEGDLAIANALVSGEDSLSQAVIAIERALACAHERGEERAVRVLHAVMALLAARPGQH